MPDRGQWTPTAEIAWDVTRLFRGSVRVVNRDRESADRGAPLRLVSVAVEGVD
jgi:hypothetical protein